MPAVSLLARSEVSMTDPAYAGVYPILLETIASCDAIIIIADKPNQSAIRIEIIAPVAIIIAIRS